MTNKMKYEKIHELLDRYWEGETSLEEERSIKEYFNAPGIDERLRPLAPMFQAFSEEQTVQLASKTKVVPMRPQMYQWAVAASLALMLAAGWWMLREGETVKAVAGIPAAEWLALRVASRDGVTPAKAGVPPRERIFGVCRYIPHRARAVKD